MRERTGKLLAKTKPRILLHPARYLWLGVTFRAGGKGGQVAAEKLSSGLNVLFSAYDHVLG